MANNNSISNNTSDVCLSEFKLLSKQLNTPNGIRKQINGLSNSISRRLTVVLQKLGINRNISKKNRNKQLLLNIGFGDAYRDDCINTDLVPTLGGMVRRVLGKSLQTPDCYLNVVLKDKHLKEIADGVIFSHVLEHMPPHLVTHVLSTIKYFIKPGGGLRISVPSIRSYETPPIPNDQKIGDYSLTNPTVAKNSLIYRWGHRFMYDSQLIVALLTEVGFVDIKEVLSEEGFLGNTDVLRRSFETIYIVAHKP